MKRLILLLSMSLPLSLLKAQDLIIEPISHQENVQILRSISDNLDFIKIFNPPNEQSFKTDKQNIIQHLHQSLEIIGVKRQFAKSLKSIYLFNYSISSKGELYTFKFKHPTSAEQFYWTACSKSKQSLGTIISNPMDVYLYKPNTDMVYILYFSESNEISEICKLNSLYNGYNFFISLP